MAKENTEREREREEEKEHRGMPEKSLPLYVVLVIFFVLSTVYSLKNDLPNIEYQTQIHTPWHPKRTVKKQQKPERCSKDKGKN